MARVSALIPTYDRAEYVGGAIETVLSQTYEDCEAVVVNDGSTDDTRAVLASYADDGRVQVHHNDRNRGIAHSFNRAAHEADGELLCILGDDDRWHPEKVGKQVREMDALPAEYGVLYTGGVATEDGQVLRTFEPKRCGDVYPEIMGSFEVGPHSSHMIRREAFERVGGFDTDFPCYVDREFVIRLAREYRFAYLDEPLVERRVHGGNVSRGPRDTDVNRMLFEKYGEEMAQYPAISRTFHAGWHQTDGAMAIEQGERSEALRQFWLAFAHEPTPFRVVLVVFAALGSRAFAAAGTLNRALTDASSRRSGDDATVLTGS